MGAKIFVYTNNGMQVQEQMPTRGFESSIEPVLHFGLANSAKADSIIVEWTNNKRQLLTSIKADTTITLYQKMHSHRKLLCTKRSPPPAEKFLCSW